MISTHAKRKKPGVMENINPAAGIRPFLLKKAFAEFARGDLSARSVFIRPPPPKKRRKGNAICLSNSSDINKNGKGQAKNYQNDDLTRQVPLAVPAGDFPFRFKRIYRTFSIRPSTVER
jgi:hypothetical protein